MTISGFKKALVATAAGLVLAIGAASTANGQNMSREYRQWQNAQREAQQRYMDYQRTRSARDYQQWQRAQARAQREYNDYQRYSRNGYNNGYYNNNGGTLMYNQNTGRYYRVYRNGSYYTTDNRGAELLRRAVNVGYQQGYREGQMDRRRGSGFNYYDESLYRNGTYGYQSYVAQDQYQYYFQQGFQRGYEDGYNSTARYGYRSGSSFNILGSVLNTILNIAAQ